MESPEEKLFLEMKQPSWSDVFKNLAFIAIAIVVAYIVTTKIGLENLRDTVSQAGIYAPLIIIILKATTLIVVPLGGAPLYPIAGAIFGFWKALGITLIGDLIGSAVCFQLSRRFGRSILHFFMSKQHMPTVEKLIEHASEKKAFVKARIFFTGFPELFAYAAGLTKIPFWFFLPIHLGIHIIFASVWILFGEVLVSGHTIAIVIAGIITSFMAFAGIWWFHSDLNRAS